MPRSFHILADVREEYNPNVKEVAEACMERGWRFHPRPPYPYLEMSGELKKDMDYKNEKHEKAMKAPLTQDAIRKAGW